MGIDREIDQQQAFERAYVPSAYGAETQSFLDQLGAVTTGYLSRRIDVDIARRLSSTGTVGVSGDQRAIRSTPQTGIAGDATSWGKLVPIAIAVVGVLLVAKLWKA